VNVFGSGRGDRTKGSVGSAHRAEHPGETSRASDVWLRALLEKTSDVICVLGADGVFLYASPAVEGWLGYLPEDLLGTVSFDYVHPDEAALVAESFAEIVKTPGVQAPIELRAQAADGSVRHVQAVPNNQLDNPVLRGVVVTFRDLTERVRVEEEVRFRARLLDAVGQAVIATNPEGKVIYWNRTAQEIYGWSREEVMGRTLSEFVISEDLREWAAEIRTSLKEGEAWSGEFTLRRKDGTNFPAMVTSTPVHDEQGILAGMIGVSTDITERKEAEARLRESEERFRSLVQNSSEIIIILDEDGTVRYQSPAVEQVTGYTSEERVGRSGFELIHPEDLGRLRRVHAEVRSDLGTGRSVEVRCRHKDGTWKYLEATVHNLLEEPGVLGIVVNARDVTERKALEGELRRRALHDRLTGLPNRQLFMDRLGQSLERTRRREKLKAAVLFMDLNDFKVINDSLGHEVGDMLLALVAQRLLHSLRREDTLARLGGDEFAVLKEIESPDEATQVAERLIEELRKPFFLEQRELFTSISIGIALGDVRQKTSGELLRDADTAMYWAKEEKSGYRVFDPSMHARALRRLDLDNDLRRALEAEEFVLHYQPITSLHTGSITGVEALVRWKHPERGLLAPSEFISISEEIGMIVPLGRWVLTEACRQAKEWQQRFRKDPPLSMSVNLSARQLYDPGIVTEVAEVLEEVGLDPQSLVLEITEGAIVEHLGDTVDKLRGLKDLGVGLTVDDFGTAYSSLSYLNFLPIERLKIDRTFVRSLSTDHENYSVVMATVMLGHAMGIEVAAVGVETLKEFDAVRTLKCDIGQGYYWWAPRPAEEAEVLLLAPNSAPEAKR
jgi:diguanylate cyclase (GGDEF)-like protein/PAS domain S-box-containing protein